MEQTPFIDLIDQYLFGKISPEEDQRLQNILTNDPEAAKIFEESKHAFQALEIERRKRLKDKLKALDKRSIGSEKSIPRWLGIGVLLLASTLFYFYMSSVYYSPDTIARRNYISSKTYIVNHPSMRTQDPRWNQADDSFHRGAYQKAIHQLIPLAETSDPDVAAVARWNILLAQLAIQGPDVKWKIALDAFEKSAPKSLSIKAQELRSLLESNYYKFFFIRFQDNFSTIKPRLI